MFKCQLILREIIRCLNRPKENITELNILVWQHRTPEAFSDLNWKKVDAYNQQSSVLYTSKTMVLEMYFKKVFMEQSITKNENRKTSSAVVY